MSTFGDKILKSLEQFTDYLKSGEPIPATRVEMTPDGPLTTKKTMQTTLTDAEQYVLDRLKSAFPAARTVNELSWWFCDMDKQGSVSDLKDALRSLKRRGLIEYKDPVGWRLK